MLDFGLARPQNGNAELTGSGVIVGTPSFMAPEQARGKRVDGRADLFSLGAVLYRCATGINPFGGDTVMSVLTSLIVDQPTPPDALNPAVPPAVACLILRLLEKDANCRPASAHDVLHLLSTLAQPATPNTTADTTFAFGASDSPSRPLPEAEAATRWPIYLAGGILTLLVLVGLGVGGWWLRSATSAVPDKPGEDVVQIVRPPATKPALRGRALWSAVNAKLAQLNGGPVEAAIRFDADDNVIGLHFTHQRHLRDIAPLSEVTTLQELQLYNTAVENLRPLAGLKLTTLRLEASPTKDLLPISRVPVQDLVLHQTPSQDIQHLQGMPLRKLKLIHCFTEDLSPLRGMSTLKELELSFISAKDISALADVPLIELIGTDGLPNVKDLRPLEKCPLERYTSRIEEIGRLPVLKKVRVVSCPDFVIWRDLEVLRGRFPAIETLDGRSFADLIRGHEEFVAWERATGALPVRQRSAAVLELLRSLNPEWKGDWSLVDEDGRVVGVTVDGTKLVDVSPLRGFPELRSLTVKGKSDLANLWPLMHLSLQELDVAESAVSDWHPLATMRVRTLRCPPLSPDWVEYVKTLPNLKTINGKPKPE